jgi:protein-tyrosine phosphatase/ribose 5-phosphate isomerase B
MYSLRDKLLEILVQDENLDIDVRHAMFTQIENQEVLVNLASSNAHGLAKLASLKFLTDCRALRQFILSNPDSDFYCSYAVLNPHFADESMLEEFRSCDSIRLRCAAIENPNFMDVSRLVDLAYNDEDSSVRASAVKGIDDDEILKDIYLNDDSEDVRNAAAENIRDNNFLYEQLMNCDDSSEKIRLLETIDDEDILVDIVLNDWTEGYRHAQYRNQPVRRFPNAYFIKMRAVKRIRSESSFIRIAKEVYTKHWLGLDGGDIAEIASYAMKHISNNQEVLTDIAYNAKCARSRLDAVKRITDENVLLEIAIRDRSVGVTQMAMLCIDDENLLFETLPRCPHTSHAIRRIENQSILLEIVKSDFKDFYRRDACEKLTSEDVLKEIFLTETDVKVRSAAISNFHLTDESFLIDAALNDPDSGVRSSAIFNYNFRNDNALREIALNDGDMFVRRQAVRKITDSEILENLIDEVDDYELCEWIVDNPNFTNQEMLEELLFSCPDDYVRSACAEKVTRRELLEKAALNDESDRVQRDAIANPNFTGHEIIRDFALNGQDSSVRREAIRKLTDNDVLCDIYYSGDDEFRYYAISGITDEEVLKDIVENDSDQFVRRMACANRNLKDNEFLKYVVRNHHSYLPLDACSRITDGEFLAKILTEANDSNLRYRACTNPNLKDKDAFLYASRYDSVKHIRDLSSMHFKSLSGIELKIMFVDYTNTVLGPMAEAVFNEMCSDVARAYTSGILAENGTPPCPMAVEVCKSHGLDISGFRATYFKDSNIEKMDAVITFNETQKDKARIYYPQLDIRRISEFTLSGHPDIARPYGLDFEAYDERYREICKAVEKIRSVFR